MYLVTPKGGAKHEFLFNKPASEYKKILMLTKKYDSLIFKTFIKFGNHLDHSAPKKLKENGLYVTAGNTKGGSITVPLASCLTGLESAV